MKKKLINIISIIFALFTGCKVGKDFQKPEVQLPTQFNNVSYADTSSIADVEWKKFFTQTELQKLIEEGVNYNYDLALAIKRMQIAQEQVKQAKNLQLPQLDVQIAAQTTRPSDNSLSGKST